MFSGVCWGMLVFNGVLWRLLWFGGMLVFRSDSLMVFC